MELDIISVILFYHFFGDFVWQSDDMAKNKSKSFKWLAVHVLVYGLALTVSLGVIYLFNSTKNFSERIIPMGSLWIASNVIFHALTDAITSRISSNYHKNGKIHEFFVTIGFDQFIHYVCLLVTFKYLVIG